MTEIKHINNQVELELFAEEIGVRSDWHEPDEQDITAKCFGHSFDNAGIWGHKVAIAPESLEMYIQLQKSGQPVAEVNLATLFSWASNHEMKSAIPEKEKSSIEANEVFNTEDFREFLYRLLCSPDERLGLRVITDSVVVAYAINDHGTNNESWSIARYSKDDRVILVTNENGTHKYECMTEEEARVEVIKAIYKRAENMLDMTELFDLLTRFIRFETQEAQDLFMTVMNNNEHMSTNWYDVLKDLDIDPDEVLIEAVEETVSQTRDALLIDVANTHFDLDSDMLIEYAIDGDKNVANDTLLDIAKEMDIELHDIVKFTLG